MYYFFYSFLKKINEVEEHFGLLLWQMLTATPSPTGGIGNVGGHLLEGAPSTNVWQQK